MQAYFHERNADTEYQPNPFGGDQGTQNNAFSAMNLAASSKDQTVFDGDADDDRTSDVFGKLLRQFKLLDTSND